MSKYNIGDKVVIRKDLVHGEYYGGWFWRKYYSFKEKAYVVIGEVYDDGVYSIGDWIITDEMIEGLYDEVNVMNIKHKYKSGDKVVIRKDLEVDEYYGDWYWSDGKDYLKELDYVVIDKIDDDGYFVKDGDCVIFITDEMIAGLYGEVNGVNIKPKYKKGDKVVIRKDLEVCEYYGNLYWNKRKEYLKEKNYVVIKEVDEDGDYWIEDKCLVSDEMIEGLYDEVNIKPKYKFGDKVVIRKDLEVDEYYGDWYWSVGKEYLKQKEYVVIDDVSIDGDYWIDNRLWITDEMIECLYDEVNVKPNYNIGDKVVIRKDLEVGEYSGVEWCIEMDYLKEKDYVVIERVDEDGDYLVGGEWYINDEMISHKYGDINSKNQLEYKELEYVNYKMQHKDLHQSIYNYNLQRQIDKALDENNTELLIELSNLMKGGVMIDN